jgi:NAD(P)-dependent dehydrogenase (short-subunit alcohol dehydrogenase family)
VVGNATSVWSAPAIAMNLLRSKVALVTGGAQGIGRGIALELARAGASVAIGDLDEPKADAVVAEIKARGSPALALPLDVTNEESAKQCVERVVRHFSRIDILVNNAGIFQRRLGFELDDRDFNRCLDINLTGVWRMVNAVLPHFKTAGRGKVVNIASTGARQGVDFAAAYCASKAGVVNLTQSLALALGVAEVNVNAVCPGFVGTAMQDEIATLRRNVGDTDGRRFLSPVLPGPLSAEDIGLAVVFLASDWARNITGQALNVDSGCAMN